MPSMPRIVVAGTQSGVGKTSIALGLVALLRRRGLRVQTFKVGPDYLDPTYLARVSGRPCYNLDGWMTGRDYVEALFARRTADADIAVIEGVMGLFDGADPVTDDGSTAQIARWLEAPVILVAGVHGMARSLAAVVSGYAAFDPGVRIGGVIANHCGSPRHADGLRESVEAATPVRLLGAVMRSGLPEFSSRHLGLVSADPRSLSGGTIEQLAGMLAPALDLDGIVRLAREASSRTGAPAEAPAEEKRRRLGLARDEAFHFYYPDNLEALERAGCELVPFSPLADSVLPEALDGLYLGGGYPEEHAAELSSNAVLRGQIAGFSGPIYAECGGLMYLSQGIESRSGVRHPQVGRLPSWTRVGVRRKMLGYVEVTLRQDTLWGERGTGLRGHEYHYSELVTDPAWSCAYSVKPRRAVEESLEGFVRGSVLASYIHLHFASRPAAVRAFMRHLELS